MAFGAILGQTPSNTGAVIERYPVADGISISVGDVVDIEGGEITKKLDYGPIISTVYATNSYAYSNAIFFEELNKYVVLIMESTAIYYLVVDGATNEVLKTKTKLVTNTLNPSTLWCPSVEKQGNISVIYINPHVTTSGNPYFHFWGIRLNNDNTADVGTPYDYRFSYTNANANYSHIVGVNNYYYVGMTIVQNYDNITAAGVLHVSSDLSVSMSIKTSATKSLTINQMNVIDYQNDSITIQVLYANPQTYFKVLHKTLTSSGNLSGNNYNSSTSASNYLAVINLGHPNGVNSYTNGDYTIYFMVASQFGYIIVNNNTQNLTTSGFVELTNVDEFGISYASGNGDLIYYCLNAQGTVSPYDFYICQFSSDYSSITTLYNTQRSNIDGFCKNTLDGSIFSFYSQSVGMTYTVSGTKEFLLATSPYLYGSTIINSTTAIALNSALSGQSCSVTFSGIVDAPWVTAGQEIKSPGVYAYAPVDGKLIVYDKNRPCKYIVSGSYTGTGTYGSNNPTTLELGFEPKGVMIFSPNDKYYYGILINGFGVSYLFGGANTNANNLTVTSTSNIISWYSIADSRYQLNSNNNTYNYIAWV